MNKIGKPSDIQYYRKDMPQVKSQHFSDFLQWASVEVEVVEVDGDSLKPTQIDINHEKVSHMVGRVLNKDPTFKGTITISKDGYVLDGHHRWLALINAGETKVKCNMLLLDALVALDKMRIYPNSKRQDINDDAVI